MSEESFVTLARRHDLQVVRHHLRVELVVAVVIVGPEQEETIAEGKSHCVRAKLAPVVSFLSVAGDEATSSVTTAPQMASPGTLGRLL
ncbi:MAG: hypothetical protein U0263_12740 [Polyangiaceae bacterium]